MKELDMIKLNDIPDEPSDELKSRTLAAMRAIEEKKTQRKVPVWRKIAVCAAMFCAALVLMGAGVKVFDYLTFVPGMGIVTADQAEVYTLEHVVEAGRYRIEAASMIPVTEGEHEGMWEVTVLTDMDVPVDFAKNPNIVTPITLLTASGESYSLKCRGGSSDAKFVGYADIDGAGDYTLMWYNEEYTITMKSIENSVWANYSYPICDGITVIAFPLAEGSDKLVFDIIVEPESENMEFWASHCESIQYHMTSLPGSITVTDVEGKVYTVGGQRLSSVDIPVSEMEHGVNSLLNFKYESYLRLNEPLTAEVAKIEINEIALVFNGIDDGVGVYTVTIPEAEETIPGENLPNGGVFLDEHGVKAAFDTMYAGAASNAGEEYEIIFRGAPAEVNFEETSVKEAAAYLSYIEPKNLADRYSWDMYQGSTVGNPEGADAHIVMTYKKSIRGYGDKKIRKYTGTLDLGFGEEVYMKLQALTLIIDGNWTIDFTAPKATE